MSYFLEKDLSTSFVTHEAREFQIKISQTTTFKILLLSTAESSSATAQHRKDAFRYDLRKQSTVQIKYEFASIIIYYFLNYYYYYYYYMMFYFFCCVLCVILYML